MRGDIHGACGGDEILRVVGLVRAYSDATAAGRPLDPCADGGRPIHPRVRGPLAVTALIALFGLLLAPLFTAGITGVVIMMALGLALMGLTYGPLGTVVSEFFPTPVRYTRQFTRL